MTTPSTPTLPHPEAADAISLPQAIAAAGRLDAQLHAFIYRPSADGYPLHGNSGKPTALTGVPVAVKDLIDTADMPTAYGSAVFKGHQPTKDAWIVTRLREAGAVIFGKTVTTEFAWRDPGATVNPWNNAHSPGGSSSGSAAAVGAGIVDIALGTQTVGSVIRPASYCGAIGYKPTFGLIPTDGVHDLAPSLDHLGFITSSIYWAAVCEAIIVQGKAFDPDSFDRQGKKPARIGIYRSAQWADVEPEVQQNFDAAVRRMRACGVDCVDVEFELDLRELNTLTSDILAYEAHAAIAGDIKGREELAGSYTRELLTRGASISTVEYARLVTQLASLRANRDAAFSGIDAIVTITSPTTALHGLQKTGDASFCAPATLLGLPAVTVPSGFSTQYLPFGVQLIGPGHADLATLMMGQWLSTMLPTVRAPALMT